VGLVIGFYVYFGLYSGNWQFLFGGVWNETNQFSTLFAPGFYIRLLARSLVVVCFKDLDETNVA
jgi:hypothetical protein